MQAQSIDEVIRMLDGIIQSCREQNSRLGYFPALYRKVTIEVKRGIANNFFDDGKRMERLDVTFANRYLEAYEAFRSGKPTTPSWRIAFDAGNDRWAIVLQHLLLGINAHINLDLGIAAARTSPGSNIHDLKTDFDKINNILASLINNVENALTEVWPMLKLLSKIAGRDDEKVINFSMNVARAQAWNLALALANLDERDSQPVISAADNAVFVIGNSIQHPGPIVGSITNFIRLGERGSVPKIISILEAI